MILFVVNARDESAIDLSVGTIILFAEIVLTTFPERLPIREQDRKDEKRIILCSPPTPLGQKKRWTVDLAGAFRSLSKKAPGRASWQGNLRAIAIFGDLGC
jgi:hypothetical protein